MASGQRGAGGEEGGDRAIGRRGQRWGEGGGSAKGRQGSEGGNKVAGRGNRVQRRSGVGENEG